MTSRDGLVTAYSTFSALATFVQSRAQELNVNLSHIPTEVVDWGNNPTESNFRDASQAIVSSQPRTYFFWLLPQLPYRDYGQSFENLP